ncbi:hypothetical protein Bbelb_236290 [Branchiostoma belcheri]|nr:hypothetical protein Bbelb_236290 [Branchiostoma belcheri]
MRRTRHRDVLTHHRTSLRVTTLISHGDVLPWQRQNQEDASISLSFRHGVSKLSRRTTLGSILGLVLLAARQTVATPLSCGTALGAVTSRQSCPYGRNQRSRLMEVPTHAADCISAMRTLISPITRPGVTDLHNKSIRDP